jgi:hypothetical protein
VLQINSIEVEVEETNKPKIRNTHEITLKIRIEFIDHFDFTEINIDNGVANIVKYLQNM